MPAALGFPYRELSPRVSASALSQPVVRASRQPLRELARARLLLRAGATLALDVDAARFHACRLPERRLITPSSPESPQEIPMHRRPCHVRTTLLAAVMVALGCFPAEDAKPRGEPVGTREAPVVQATGLM